MRIGMLSGLWWIAEELSALDSLDRMAALGFHYVDLQGSFHAGPRHLSARERIALGARLERLGLELRNYVLHPLHNIPEADDLQWSENIAYLQEGVDLAVSWGARQVMLNAGRWVHGRTREAAWRRSVEYLQQICDYAGERGVYIAQETEPYVWFLVADLASARKMAADVGRPNFVTLLDLGHMALSREGEADLLASGDSIIHGHLSDHDPFRHTNQVVGTGCAPVAEYLRCLQTLEEHGTLRRFGYDELVVSFELGMPGDAIFDPDDKVRRSLRHVLTVAPFVRL
jgi:sugar phosphate isomerase/epimerase